MAAKKPVTDIGRSRQQLWAHCKLRLKDSIAQGYSLEAIALAESMMSDRLESLTAQLAGTRIERTLGNNVNAARAIGGEYVSAELLDRITAWGKDRNRALHMMVKWTEKHDWPLEERIAATARCAKEGATLVNAVDAAVKRATTAIARDGVILRTAISSG